MCVSYHPRGICFQRSGYVGSQRPAGVTIYRCNESPLGELIKPYRGCISQIIITYNDNRR